MRLRDAIEGAVVAAVIIGMAAGLDAVLPSKHEDTGRHEFVTSNQAPTFVTLEDYLRTARSHYLATDNETDRAAIRAAVLREVAGWDLNEVKDPSLTAWVIDLRKSSGENK